MSADEMLWRDWHPVAIAADMAAGRVYETTVLGVPIRYLREATGYRASRVDGSGPCRIAERYATAWVSLSDAPRDFFAVPEFDEPDRRVVSAGSIRVHVSGLRAIENFLDMGHFPYVHPGYLGAEPHTEVLPYTVEVDAVHNEILATNCRFVQPRASAIAANPIEVSYTYRVARPYVAMLYKTCVPEPERRDVICLFVQPLSEEWCIAHTVMLYIDHVNSDEELRRFQQTIFGQDLMILINQVPKRMPLEVRHEVPVRADAMSSAYRRWLRDNRIVYGTYAEPATAEA
jgi:phenylpropionate dioxygenase-like ring-hydroxylating dioxygenase large terminal subunit